MKTSSGLFLQTQLGRAAWAVHRLRVKRGALKPFGRSHASRWLFISVADPISTAQIFPFFFYASRLNAEYGIELREITFEDFLHRAPYRDQPDVVLLQTWFDISGEKLADLARTLKSTYSGAKLVYLDWFAPTDLRFAGALDPQVDFYVKKQVLRDRAAYGKPTEGDTNLTDYYSRRLGLALEPVLHRVPESFWPRLVLGPNFALTSQILSLLFRPRRSNGRQIDVHARIAVGGTPWYSAMRKEALEAVKHIGDLRVIHSGRISRKEYIRELFSSKICFSPFGYGEVCWRDFEAALSGALLVKPAMDHIETYPDIFRPFETYVPVRWDLADLEEKIRHYLAHPAERIQIAAAAFDVIYGYFAGQGFLKQMDPVFRRILGRVEQPSPMLEPTV